jgi:hypothetical protein
MEKSILQQVPMKFRESSEIILKIYIPKNWEI